MRQTVADLMQVYNPEDGQTLIPSFSLSFCISLKLLISERLISSDFDSERQRGKYSLEMWICNFNKLSF